MTWGLSKRRSPIGIDVDGRYLGAVQLERAGGGWKLSAAVCVPRADPRADLSAEEVGQLAEVLERHGFTGRDVVVAIPADQVMTEIITVARRDEEAAVRAAVGERLSRSRRLDGGGFEMAYWPLPRPARAPQDVEVMTVACPHAAADHFLDLFESCGLSPRAMDVRAWALARACATVTGRSTGLTLVLNLGWRVAQLVVLCEGTVAFQRSLGDCGLATLFTGVGQRLEIDADVTEYLLARIGLSEEADEDAGEDAVSFQVLEELQGQLRAHLERIANELRLSISYAGQEYPDREVEAALLVGEAAGIPGQVDWLGRELGVPTRSVSPADLVEGRPGVGQADWPHLCAALGLALWRED